MPEVIRVTLFAAGKRPLLEAIALGDPERTLEQLTITAERFDLGDDIESAGAAEVLVCRSCGCSDDRACPGDCRWVAGEPDLCSRCQLAEGTRPPALVLP